MNRYNIKEIIEKTLIEYIAEEVKNRFISKNKKAIVIFTGASIGFTESIKSLRLLIEDGWKLEVVLSKGAERALTVDLIKDLLFIEEVFTDDNIIDVEKILSENNFILIPSLTIKTASKIANCISDNLPTNLISRFITTGRPVIAAINGCCPDNEERINMGFTPTESYKAKLRQNMETMRSYGIDLTLSENLYRKTNKIFLRTLGISETKEIKESFGNNKSIDIQSRVITRSTILDYSIYDVLNLRDDSIITDLAKEEANKRNINLIKVSRW